MFKMRDESFTIILYSKYKYTVPKATEKSIDRSDGEGGGEGWRG